MDQVGEGGGRVGALFRQHLLHRPTPQSEEQIEAATAHFMDTLGGQQPDPLEWEAFREMEIEGWTAQSPLAPRDNQGGGVGVRGGVEGDSGSEDSWSLGEGLEIRLEAFREGRHSEVQSDWWQTEGRDRAIQRDWWLAERWRSGVGANGRTER